MSYVIKAALSNSHHPEYGQITVPFPIPGDQYDQTMERLGSVGIGDALAWDCQIDTLDSFYAVLNRLEGTSAKADELDYLAKRLDSFDDGEAAQFQAMAHKLNVIHIVDFINLTFCCQQTTVITDFSKLEQTGKEHALNVNGGAMPTKDYDRVDGRAVALELIRSGSGTVTPYGVVYDNGMVLEPVYNGHQLPAYLYDRSPIMLQVTPKQGLAEGEKPEYLYLPATERQIERTLLRIGVTALYDTQVRLDFEDLPKKVSEALDMEGLSGDDIPAFNRMCRAIGSLEATDVEKLNAVMLMTGAADTIAICRLAENLEQFDFIPGIRTPDEYGRYMIQQSGRFDYDENLEGFYDYRRYGEQQLRQEGGQFNECGYVVYQGTMPLEELMMEDPAEKHQREQGLQMGGVAQ